MISNVVFGKIRSEPYVVARWHSLLNAKITYDPGYYRTKCGGMIYLRAISETRNIEDNHVFRFGDPCLKCIIPDAPIDMDGDWFDV